MHGDRRMQRKETQRKDREDDGKTVRGKGRGETQWERGRAAVDSGQCTFVNVPQVERRNKRTTTEMSPDEERSQNGQKARRMQMKDGQTGEKRRSGTEAQDRKEKSGRKLFEGSAFRKTLKERKREETEHLQTLEAETRRQASSWQQEQSGDRAARRHSQEKRRRAEDERSRTRATERKNEEARKPGRAEGWRPTAGDEGSREERRRRRERKRTSETSDEGETRSHLRVKLRVESPSGPHVLKCLCVCDLRSADVNR
ncbi:hypothetical protein TGGT1_409520 [Toxoplasma gondii GT1]|uniref:Uncharacterized protein n=1 Tax=Toxoplasma gondii (strain ATCC 50853 / GT1) TaxID=507601 RepID=S7URV9_TOXGG|nr:hypothetical protein TGGT1_409520 [Toxoplasma gondii GT1]